MGLFGALSTDKSKALEEAVLDLQKRSWTAEEALGEGLHFTILAHALVQEGKHAVVAGQASGPKLSAEFEAFTKLAGLYMSLADLLESEKIERS